MKTDDSEIPLDLARKFLGREILRHQLIDVGVFVDELGDEAQVVDLVAVTGFRLDHFGLISLGLVGVGVCVVRGMALVRFCLGLLSLPRFSSGGGFETRRAAEGSTQKSLPKFLKLM